MIYLNIDFIQPSMKICACKGKNMAKIKESKKLKGLTGPEFIYRDRLGFNVGEKAYEKSRLRALKRKEKRKKELAKKVHKDTISKDDRFLKNYERGEKQESAVIKEYRPTEKYKAKIKNYYQPRKSDLSMEDLMKGYAKEIEQDKKDTKLYGRPKKKGELGV